MVQYYQQRSFNDIRAARLALGLHISCAGTIPVTFFHPRVNAKKGNIFFGIVKTV